MEVPFPPPPSLTFEKIISFNFDSILIKFEKTEKKNLKGIRDKESRYKRIDMIMGDPTTKYRLQETISIVGDPTSKCVL